MTLDDSFIVIQHRRPLSSTILPNNDSVKTFFLFDILREKEMNIELLEHPTSNVQHRILNERKGEKSFRHFS